MLNKLVYAEPMTFRQQIRLAVVGALQGLTLNSVAVDIESPGDWNFETADLPAIAVRTKRDGKSSTNKVQPAFTTSQAVEIKAVCAATTAEAAQSAIELLWYQVEWAILTNAAILAIIQQVSLIESDLDINAEGQQHIAGMSGSFTFETFEVFDIGAMVPPATQWPSAPPSAIIPLNEIDVDLDLTNVFDASGTYAAPEINGETVDVTGLNIQPAPRVSGPDGRPEGALTIDLTGD